LVRLVASEANHIDRYILSGQYQTTLQFPFIVGRDAVGVVADVGSGITKFAVGDAVWTNSLGYDGRQGAMAEYVVAQGDRLYHLAGGYCPHRSRIGFFTVEPLPTLDLYAKDICSRGIGVFVGGAGGAVGSAALQIAVAMEAIVAVSASPEDERWCRSLGASLVVDYHDANYQEQVARHLGPVDIWWDTSGNP
jgi:NADPH:quinone reductase-like Zn-dependent oxidoreductase